MTMYGVFLIDELSENRSLLKGQFFNEEDAIDYMNGLPDPDEDSMFEVEEYEGHLDA